jgi:hypothetical protein
MTKTLFTVLFFSVLMSSCATIVGGRTYVADVVVVDQPDVTIYIDGALAGKGAVTFEQKRKDRLNVTVKKDDCKPESENFSIETRPLLLTFDLINVIGLVVDFGTGAIYRPDFRVDPQVEKIHYDRYRYNIYYDGCKTMD